MFLTLSPDVSLAVLALLPLPDVLKLYKLSRSVYRFLKDHEDALFHQLAVLHRYAQSGVTLDDAITSEARNEGYHLKAAKTWKDLCKQYWTLGRNWSGRGYVVQGSYKCFEHEDILKFTIDEEHGLIVTRNAENTLKVHELSGMRCVWRLSNVFDFTHSGRFLILRRARERRFIEIWRLVEDDGTSISPLLPPSSLAATELQLQQSEEALGVSVNASRRYAAYGRLPAPTVGSAWWMSALRDPHLAVVSSGQPHLIHIYDIARGELHQLIDLDPILVSSAAADSHLLLFSVLFDIQLSDKYLCAGFDTTAVLVQLRQGDDSSQYSNYITTGFNKTAVVYADETESFDVQKTSLQAFKVDRSENGREIKSDVTCLNSDVVGCTVVAGNKVFEEYVVAPPTDEQRAHVEDLANAIIGPRRHNHPSYISNSFSPDGRHLVSVTAFGIIYFFPDIHRLFTGALTASDIVQKMYAGATVVRVNWAGQNRAFVYEDEEKCVVLVDMNPTYDSDIDNPEPTLALDGARVLRLRHRANIDGITSSNLQLRKTGLWMRMKVYRRLADSPGHADAAPMIVTENDPDESNENVSTIYFNSFTPASEGAVQQ